MDPRTAAPAPPRHHSLEGLPPLLPHAWVHADVYAEWRLNHGLLHDPIAVFPTGKLPTHSSTRVKKVLAERLPYSPQLEVDPADYGKLS